MNLAASIPDVALVGAALVPALFVWWRGRSLYPLAEHPLLTERAAVCFRPLFGLYLLTLLALLVGAQGAALLALLALTVVSLMFANFQLRRTLWRQRWRFATFLYHQTRMLLAFRGSAVLLFFTPSIVWWSSPRWAVAALLTLLLVSWSLSGRRWFLALSGATPLDRPALSAALDDIAGRAAVAPPPLYEIPQHGGLPNAFALPARRRPAVAFTGPLLDSCEPSEIAAVLAHELAHLEQFDRRWWRRYQTLSLATIAAATLTPLAVAVWRPALFEPVWALLVFQLALILAFRFGYKRLYNQQHEIDADQRAVALGASGEALISGLGKIHRLGLQPRRWPVGAERGASHPSLVERARLVRAAMGVPAPRIVEPVTIESALADARVMLYADHLLRTDATAAPVERRCAYRDLRDIRLTVAGDGSAHLQVTPSAGRVWSMPIRDRDVERLQRATDALLPLLAAPPTSTGAAALGGFVAALLATLFALSGQLGVLFVAALLAVLRPGAAAFAALAAAVLGLCAAVWVWGDAAAPLSADLLPLLAGCGALAAFVAYRYWRDPTRRYRYWRWTALIYTVLAAGGWLQAGAALWFGLPMTLWSGAAAANAPLVAVTLALALALCLAPRALWRVVAPAPLTLALLLLLLGSVRFDTYMTAPDYALAARVDADTAQPVALWPERRIPLDDYAYRLRVSPGGGVAVQQYDESGLLFRIWPADGDPLTLHVEQLDFIDDGRVLTATTESGRARLQVQTLDGRATAPFEPADLPLRYVTALRVDPRTRRWQVSGWGEDYEHFIALNGTVGERGVELRRWPELGAPDDRDDVEYLQSTVAGDQLLRTVAVSTTQYPFAETPRLAQIAGLFFDWPLAPLTELWRRDADGWRRQTLRAPALDCASAPSGADAAALCLSAGRGASRLWRYDPTTADWRAYVEIAGQVQRLKTAADGRLLLLGGSPTVRLVDLRGGRIDELSLRVDSARVTDAALSGNTLWALSYYRGETELLRFSAAP